MQFRHLACTLVLLALTSREAESEEQIRKGIRFTMPKSNAQLETAANPFACDSTGAELAPSDSLYWRIYRATIAAPLVSIDSLAAGIALPGDRLSVLWEEMKSVPVGPWCFHVVVADRNGNACPAEVAAGPIYFARVDSAGPAPILDIRLTP